MSRAATKQCGSHIQSGRTGNTPRLLVLARQAAASWKPPQHDALLPRHNPPPARTRDQARLPAPGPGPCLAARRRPGIFLLPRLCRGRGRRGRRAARWAALETAWPAAGVAGGPGRGGGGGARGVGGAGAGAGAGGAAAGGAQLREAASPPHACLAGPRTPPPPPPTCRCPARRTRRRARLV